MAERVDVCIVGSGFGGSIAAWRLAELYSAAEQDAGVLVLERGLRFGNTDFRQSMDVGHLSDVYELIQGQGAQIVAHRVQRNRQHDPDLAAGRLDERHDPRGRERDAALAERNTVFRRRDQKSVLDVVVVV